ncbi:DUF423 domain-containing protein [Archangium violaceum]|uniref:DUF423 domain-containing protein n=1 Tax=Archangium violaceum TaxID=83451 RepID=UPI00194E3870|nr:DUF423 domain-containing protein [Archangium violaceum]QRO00309.1 DUF423 domain-containing protein [Archangium violaceum]
MRLWLILGAASAFISVAAGAFGAHALKTRLSADLLTIFETGARYQMYHSLGLIAMGLLMQLRPNPLLNAAGWAMLAGIVLFSGSLYALALSGVRVLGAITPFGGVGFLVGWVLFALAAWRQTG